MVELLVAISLLLFALVPLAYSIGSERRLARALYQRAVAMEIVDGELEVLAAGAWRSYPNGVAEYEVHSFAQTNLPPGQFWLSLSPEKIRLEWRPTARQHGGGVVRQLALKH
jgi:hypothetical protein